MDAPGRCYKQQTSGILIMHSEHEKLPRCSVGDTSETHFYGQGGRLRRKQDCQTVRAAALEIHLTGKRPTVKRLPREIRALLKDEMVRSEYYALMESPGYH